MNNKLLAIAAALVFSLAACSNDDATAPSAEDEISDELAEYVEFEGQSAQDLDAETQQMFDALYSEYSVRGEDTGEISRVVAEYVLKDQATYDNVTEMYMSAIEGQASQLSELAFPDMERLEVPGVYQFEFVYTSPDKSDSVAAIVLQDVDGEVCVLESEPVESSATVCP